MYVMYLSVSVYVCACVRACMCVGWWVCNCAAAWLQRQLTYRMCLGTVGWRPSRAPRAEVMVHAIYRMIVLALTWQSEISGAPQPSELVDTRLLRMRHLKLGLTCNELQWKKCCYNSCRCLQPAEI